MLVGKKAALLVSLAVGLTTMAFGGDVDSRSGDLGTASGGRADSSSFAEGLRACEPRWTATSDAIFLTRSAAGGQQLVTDPLSGDTLLNASDLTFSPAAGPRLSLIRHGASGWDIELNYFSIQGWGATADVPNASFPMGFGYLAIDEAIPLPVTDAAFQYHSRLDSGELNFRHRVHERLTWLAGFRWVELGESYDVTGTESIYSTPFQHNVRAFNHLYGAQAGADLTLWKGEKGLRIDALGRAGIFYNAADQDNILTDPAGIGTLSAAAATSHTAFVGEVGLVGSYQVNRHLSVRGGYELMWIDGVALAPNQIAATDFGLGSVGVNASSSVFYHGATAGLQLAW